MYLILFISFFLVAVYFTTCPFQRIMILLMFPSFLFYMIKVSSWSCSSETSEICSYHGGIFSLSVFFSLTCPTPLLSSESEICQELLFVAEKKKLWTEISVWESQMLCADLDAFPLFIFHYCNIPIRFSDNSPYTNEDIRLFKVINKNCSKTIEQFPSFTKAKLVRIKFRVFESK